MTEVPVTDWANYEGDLPEQYPHRQPRKLNRGTEPIAGPDRKAYTKEKRRRLKARSPTLTVTKVETNKKTPRLDDITFENGLVTGYSKSKNAKVGDKFVVSARDNGRFAHILDAEEDSTPIQDPMELGEMANWTPLDGSEGLKRKRAEAGPDYETRGATFQCPKNDCGCRGCYGCMGEDENSECACCGYIFEDGPTGVGEHQTYKCSCGVRACAGCIGEDDPTCQSCGIIFEHTMGPFDEDGNYTGNAESEYDDYFGAEQWKPMPQCEECGAVEGGNIDGCDDCDITYWFNGKVYHPDSMIHIGAETFGAESPSATIPIKQPSWIAPVATALGFGLGFLVIKQLKKEL